MINCSVGHRIRAGARTDSKSPSFSEWDWCGRREKLNLTLFGVLGLALNTFPNIYIMYIYIYTYISNTYIFTNIHVYVWKCICLLCLICLAELEVLKFVPGKNNEILILQNNPFAMYPFTWFNWLEWVLEKQLDESIHPKREKRCGFCFSIQNIFEDRCVNRSDKFLRQ